MCTDSNENPLTFALGDHLDAVTEIIIAASRQSLDWFRQPPTGDGALQVDNKLAGTATGAASSPRFHFDPVTEADRAVEDALRSALTERFPHHEIHGEEAGISGQGPYRWVIDPIDGTRAFISGNPLWGTLVGLRSGDNMLAGWLHNPVLEETYIGCAEGSVMRDRHGSHELQVRGGESLAEAIVLCTHPDMFAPGPEQDAFSRLSDAVRMVRYGGDCMNFAYLAAGYCDLVVENDLQPYDIAALIPIIEGAGGVITDVHGAVPLEGGFVVAAGSAAIHAAALDCLGEFNL